MKNVRVYLTDQEAEVLTYRADSARTGADDCGRKTGYTEIVQSTLHITEEYGLFGQKIRDWRSWDYEQVALIKTDLIVRIEVVEVDA